MSHIENSDHLDDDQIQRITDVEYAVMDLCGVIAGEKAPEYNASYVFAIAEYVTMCMLKHGCRVYFPFEEEQPDGTTKPFDYFTVENTPVDDFNPKTKGVRNQAMTPEQTARVEEINTAVLTLCRYMTEKDDLQADPAFIEPIAQAAVEELNQYDPTIQAEYPVFLPDTKD